MQDKKDMQNIRDRYPNIELPYDKMLHKEVPNQYTQVMLCPSGYRATLWFTYSGSQNVAVLTTYNRNNQIYQQKIVTVCFNKLLSSGTLLVGTFFVFQNKKCFACEHIKIYRNAYVPAIHSSEILGTVIRNYISQKAYNLNFTIVALPIITSSLKKAAEIAMTLPYRIHCARLIMNNSVTKNIMRLPKCGIVLQIKADLDADIYHLYCKKQNSNKLIHCGIAAIQSYNTSIKLNKLFRKIKENHNLDLLEESDDEEEFEDTSEDKYVDLSKNILMRCEYKPRFKKWEPICTVSNNSYISTFDAVKRSEK